MAEGIAAPSHDIPRSGGIPYSIGQPAVVRIPIPGTEWLCNGPRSYTKSLVARHFHHP